MYRDKPAFERRLSKPAEGKIFMRIFFGLDIDNDTRRALADWRDRHAVAAGRAVPATNFHVTLAFIGEVDNRQLDALCRAVDAWEPGPDTGAGAILLDQVGYWPKPGIYWTGPSSRFRVSASIPPDPIILRPPRCRGPAPTHPRPDRVRPAGGYPPRL